MTGLCFVGCNVPKFNQRPSANIDSQLPWKPFTSAATLALSPRVPLRRHVLKATGTFSREQRLDSESVTERQLHLFERLLAADPKDVGMLCSFAAFLQNVKQDYDKAAAMYEKALLADPVQARELCLQLYDKPPPRKKKGKRRGEQKTNNFAIRRPVVPRLAIGKIAVPRVVLPRNNKI